MQTQNSAKQIEELQKQLGELNSKSAKQMEQLTIGFQTQQKALSEQVSMMQKEAELRIKDISEKTPR